MSEERYLVEGLTAMGYRVEVHADGAALVGYHGDERRKRRTSLSGARSWTAPPTTLGSSAGKTVATRRS